MRPGGGGEDGMWDGGNRVWKGIGWAVGAGGGPSEAR